MIQNPDFGGPSGDSRRALLCLEPG